MLLYIAHKALIFVNNETKNNVFSIQSINNSQLEEATLILIILDKYKNNEIHDMNF